MNSTEQSYRAYWATLTGKSEREIYVPKALRDEPVDSCPDCEGS